MTISGLIRSSDRTSISGLTLVEVMVTLAIIAILAGLAYPQFNGYMLRAHRADAKAILMESAQTMERIFTTNNTYAGFAVPSNVSPKGATGNAIRYNISFPAPATASAYTLQAVPTGAQANDTCGTLTITNTGAQTPTTAGCW